MTKIFSAGAVLFRREKEKKYLLLKYKKGHWGLPKGWIEEGESPEESAKREIEEETGIKDVRFMKGFKENINYFYKEGNETVYKEVVYFIAETPEREVEISDEHIDSEWLGYEEAYERLTYDNVRDILKKAHEFITQNDVSAS